MPLAHLFAAHGVTCPQAERLLRAVCVREAAATEAKSRKKPNVSRIALLTGLDRKEVARLLKWSACLERVLATRSLPGDRVLEGWYADQTFAEKGRPLTLSIKAPQSGIPSFWSLARRYAPGVYPGLILRELLRVGAVKSLRDGRVRARRRRIVRGEASPGGAEKLRPHLDGVLRPAIPESYARKLNTQQRTRRG